MRHADDLIPRIDQLLGHDLPVVKRICELRDLSEHRLPAMQHAKQFRGVPLDLGIPDLLRNLVEFWAAEGVIESPHNVHVRLRHRLPRQPQGFEGLLVLKEVLDEDDAAFAEGADFRGAELAFDAAVKPAHVPAHSNEDSIPEVHYLLDTDVRSPRLPRLPVPGDGGISAIDALLGPAGVGPEEDVRV